MLGVLSWLGWAVLGLITAWHGFTGTRYRSLLMRLRGEQGVPMKYGHRVLIISVGVFLAVVSGLLAFGFVQ
jgi:hypothetical protein